VARPWIEVSCGGEFPLEVHGESFHQPLLNALVQSHDPEVADDRIRATFMVGLAREATNPHDANAVAVIALNGDQLGHIPRELASEYSRALSPSERHLRVACKARAFGRRIGGNWNIGIWLAIPDADVLGPVLAEAVTRADGATPGETLAKRELMR
jgi:HIRAN domain